jgi:hypothetical protein
MGKRKKFFSDLWANILAGAIYDAVKSLWGLFWKNKIILILSAIWSGAFSWFGKVIGWFSSMNTIYTVCVVVLSFIAFFSIFSFGSKIVTRKKLEAYKDIKFQQHWFQPNLIEIVHGDQKKGIGIRVNNNGNKSILSFRVEMKRLYYKKSLSEEFKEISIETHPFWWDLGNSHAVNLEELDVDRHAILMFASPVSAFPHFVFMTSAVPPDSNYSGVPRYDGYYKVFLQFTGVLKNNGNKVKPILFRAEFKYENLEFSEFKGQGYAKE